MFIKTGKLLVTNLENHVLYEFGVSLYSLTNEIGATVGVLVEHTPAILEALNDFEKAFTKMSKHPLTAKIKEKHEQRIMLYRALKQQISFSQLLFTNPVAQGSAIACKDAMYSSGLWVKCNFSYRLATQIIRQLIQECAKEPFAQWMVDLSLASLIESLQDVQTEYETLKHERIEDKGNDLTLVQKAARRNLIEAVMSTLSTIDFAAQRGNENVETLVNEVSEMIVETNSLTRAAKTRMEKGEVEPIAEEEAPVYE